MEQLYPAISIQNIWKILELEFGLGYTDAKSCCQLHAVIGYCSYALWGPENHAVSYIIDIGGFTVDVLNLHYGDFSSYYESW